MSNIERQKLDNKILLCFYKHRGDIFAISQELGVPEDYIQKITKKIKNRQKRECDFLISSTIMEHLMMGTNQRTKALSDILARLDRHIESYVSACCEAPFTVRTELATTPTYFCSSCTEMCRVICKLDKECVTLVNETITNLRDEDDAIVKFADKLGFTNKEEQPQTKITQYNINVAGQLDEGTKQDVQKLTHAERNKLRRTIENRLLDES